ncbi:MAG: GNAT family N-acetyltransferase [Thermomicrobiales bacterium]
MQRVLHTWARVFARLAQFGLAGRQKGISGTTTLTHNECMVSSGTDQGEIIREGARVRLRRHVPANRARFQQWYADEEIANLLRHDLRPLNERQSRSYFDTIILPMSARGLAFAIHERSTDELIGTTALTDTDDYAPDARLFRIVIGEKAYWNHGFGTEATRLVVEEAFAGMGLNEVRLEVFAHNPRAIAVYEGVGFKRTGEHLEYLGPDRPKLHVFEMSLHLEDWLHLQSHRIGDQPVI